MAAERDPNRIVASRVEGLREHAERGFALVLSKRIGSARAAGGLGREASARELASAPIAIPHR